MKHFNRVVSHHMNTILLLSIICCLSFLSCSQPAQSSEKALVSFSFAVPTAIGKIDEAAGTVAISVPYGTKTSSLVALFESTGSGVFVGSVSQKSGNTSNDFSSPVKYTVEAVDGSTKDYIITVSIAADSSKAITSFYIVDPISIGEIDESKRSISVTVPYSTTLSNLVAAFTTTGAMVTIGSTSQTSGSTQNDFTSPIKYSITAADGTSVDYTTTITIAEPSFIKGIEITSYQGAVVDWGKIKASGIEFACIRAMSGTSVDTAFTANWDGAKAAGVLRAPYQYVDMSLDPTAEGISFVNLFLASYGSGDLPPIADVEETKSSLTVDERVKWLTIWAATVKNATGMTPIIYSSLSYINTYLNEGKGLVSFPLYIASFASGKPVIPSAWTHWTFWQYAAINSIPGIPTLPVYGNYFCGTRSDLQAIAKPY